jgi:flagellar hook-associated protein 1 FlgK
MASSVAVLNEQIQKATTTGGAPNELMDKRDQLVTRIVELTGATTQASRNGQVDLYLGGGLLVQGNLTNKLTVSENPNTMSDVVNGQLAAEKLADTSLTLSTADRAAYQALVVKGTITVKVGENVATPLSGKLAGQVEALSKTLPKASRDYDAVATSLAQKVNALQKSAGGIDGNGKTISATPGTPAGSIAGTDLFTSNTPSPFTDRITAGGLALNEAMTSNTLVLGMAANGAKDGSVAVKIAAIGTSKADPTSSDPLAKMDPPDRMWASYVADLGARSSSAEARTSAAQAVLTSSIADQQGSAGVSLDEESADLIAAQRAYQGAARVLTAVDEMLDTLINKTGLVGR